MVGQWVPFLLLPLLPEMRVISTWFEAAHCGDVCLECVSKDDMLSHSLRA
jgi:hypothetical protein